MTTGATPAELARRAVAAERTVDVLKKKVFDLYNGDHSTIDTQLEKARKRDEESRRKREVMEVRAVELKRYTQTLEAEVARRTRAIKTILDNVTFGFLVVNRELRVQPESTRSCTDLLASDQVEGRELSVLLAMAPRKRAEFLLAADQVFEDLLPEEVSLGQLQSKFPLENGRIIKAEGSVVRGANAELIGILFTISDITALEEATRESHTNRSLVSILKQKSAFQSFLIETKELLAAADTAVALGGHDVVRRAVHTIKGNSASYGLSDLVALTHDIEDNAEITSQHLESIEVSLRSFLQSNVRVLELDLDHIADQAFEVTRTQMNDLRAIIADMPAPGNGELRRWTDDVFRKPANHLLGPVDDFAAKLAERLGKDLSFELTGAETLMDIETARPVLQTLSHLVRNAIDHGIEAPNERGSKPVRGRLRVALGESADCYTMVVEDDGRGIRVPVLIKNALEKGFLTADKADAIGYEEGLTLIFLDGVSTAPLTTTISGRGIGMSAVRGALEGVHGTIGVTSVTGVGTTFTLTIPKSRGRGREGDGRPGRL